MSVCRFPAVALFAVLFAVACFPAALAEEEDAFENGDTFLILHTTDEDGTETFGADMADVEITDSVELEDFGGLFDVDVNAADSQFSFTYVGEDMDDVVEQKIYIGITDLLINQEDPEKSGSLSEAVTIENIAAEEVISTEGGDDVTFPKGGMVITIAAGTALAADDTLIVAAIHDHDAIEEDDDDDDGVCVEQSSIPDEFLGHLVHSSPRRATVLCVKAIPELPCGTARHTLTVNGKATSYGEVCESEACEKKVTYVNAVLKHMWENQVFADGKVVLTMGDSAVPPMLYSAAHIAVHFWRAASGLAAPVVSSVLSASK